MTHLPAVPSIWATDLFARVFAGFSIYAKNTVNTLKNARLPVFMVHGTGDDFVPCEMTKAGYDACTGPKELLLVEGAGHGTSFIKDKDTYTGMICAFLKTNLEGFE